MIEKVRAIRRDQDVCVGVLEKVGDLAILERRIGGETAPPPQGVRVGPCVFVNMPERFGFMQWDHAPRRIDAADSIEVKHILQALTEGALTTIPVTVKND